MLAKLPAEEWNENLFKHLSGDCSGLSEIRFKADKMQQRPIGFRSDTAEYTLLFCATEKGGKFVPLSACVTARKSKGSDTQ